MVALLLYGRMTTSSLRLLSNECLATWVDPSTESQSQAQVTTTTVMKRQNRTYVLHSQCLIIFVIMPPPLGMLHDYVDNRPNVPTTYHPEYLRSLNHPSLNIVQSCG